MAQLRTIRAGDSIGRLTNQFSSYGTLGLGVKDATGNVYALSCAHVVSPWMDHQPKGATVESPAVAGQIPGANVIGSIKDWTILQRPGENTVDAALVLKASPVDISNGSIPLAPTQPTLELDVAEFNRFSGRVVTIHSKRSQITGIVDQVYNGEVFNFDGRDYTFSNVLCYTNSPIQRGDSGSAVIDRDSGLLLGLHFAGNEAARVGHCILASLIWRVFGKYGLVLLP